MTATSTLSGLRCIRCGAEDPSGPAASGCSICADERGRAALATVYDLERASASFDPEQLRGRRSGPRHFAELLPAEISMAPLREGDTPMLNASNLARRLGVRRLWVKDESRNPTWSFKDRAAAIAVARARSLGSRAVVVSSTGNAAAATSAYAQALGVDAIVLFATGVDPLMAAYVRGYGACVVATPTKADRWVLMRRLVEDHGCYPNSNYSDPPVGNDPYALDGYKRIAFEIWEQLGYRTPDWVFGAVGYGDSLFAMYKAFAELESMGLASPPRLGAGVVFASLTSALEGNDEFVPLAEPTGHTIASSIATAQSTLQALVSIRSTAGAVCRTPDAAIRQAQALLVSTQGIFVEASSAAGLAALVQALESGMVDPGSEVVFVNTSAGLKSVAALGYMDWQPPIAHDLESLLAHVNNDLASDIEGSGR